MNIVNPILSLMVENDLKTLGLKVYNISDHVLVNESAIVLKNHEYIYVYACNVDANSFKLNLHSDADLKEYSETLMHLNFNGIYESNIISKHKGRVSIQASGSFNYQLKYLKISY